MSQLDELATAQARHAHYYLDYVSRLSADATGQNDVEVVVAMRVEHPNVRTAFHWFHAQGDVERCVQFCELHISFWIATEERDSLTCLQATLDLLASESPSAGYVNVLAGMGLFTSMFHSRLAGRPYFERALVMNEQTGNRANPKWIGMSYGLLAWTFFSHGADYERSDALFVAAQQYDIASGDSWALAMTLSNRGVMAMKIMRFAQAQGFLEEALLLHRQIGDPWGTAYALTHYGGLHVLLRRDKEAALLLAEAKELAQSIAATGLLLQHDYYVALLAMRQNAYGDVRRLLQRVLNHEPGAINDLYTLERMDACVLLSMHTNQPRKTLRLAAAIEALQRERQLIAAPLSAHQIGEAVATAHTLLSKEEAAIAWIEGADMTLEEAIALCLDI